MPDKYFIDFDTKTEIEVLAEFLAALRCLGRPFSTERNKNWVRVFILGDR